MPHADGRLNLIGRGGRAGTPLIHAKSRISVRMAEAHWDGQLGCFMLPIKALVLILAQQMPPSWRGCSLSIIVRRVKVLTTLEAWYIRKKSMNKSPPGFLLLFLVSSQPRYE